MAKCFTKRLSKKVLISENRDSVPKASGFALFYLHASYPEILADGTNFSFTI